jgi:predicted O-methyltransferase YrrM
MLHVDGDLSQRELLADRLFASRPKWITKGSLGFCDTRYLLDTAYRARAEVAVEIGTASGFSTTVICHGLHLAAQARQSSSPYRVASYDSATKFYGDQTKDVGAAARELLSDELLEHVIYRNPARAADLGTFHAPGEIGYLFIDADHRHPWPTLDLLAALPYLAPLATVVLHDINLPRLHPTTPGWGAKYLFDDLGDLRIQKDVCVHQDLPNIGSFVVPEDSAAFGVQLRRVLWAHEWQAPVGDQYLRRLGLNIESRE